MVNVGWRVARLTEALPLDTMEINPLRVGGSQMKFVDTLVVCEMDQDKEHKENDP